MENSSARMLNFELNQSPSLPIFSSRSLSPSLDLRAENAHLKIDQLEKDEGNWRLASFDLLTESQEEIENCIFLVSPFHDNSSQTSQQILRPSPDSTKYLQNLYTDSAEATFGSDQFIDRIPFCLEWCSGFPADFVPQMQASLPTLQSPMHTTDFCRSQNIYSTEKFFLKPATNRKRKQTFTVAKWQKALDIHKEKIQLRFPEQPKPHYVQAELVCLKEPNPKPIFYKTKQPTRNNFACKLQLVWQESTNGFERLSGYSNSIRGLLQTLSQTAPSDRSLTTVRLFGDLTLTRVAEMWPDLYDQFAPLIRIVLTFSVFKNLTQSTRPFARALIASYQEDVLNYRWIANLCLNQHPSQHPLVDRMKKLTLKIDKLGTLLMLFARLWHYRTKPNGCIRYKCWCSDWNDKLITYFQQILATHLHKNAEILNELNEKPSIFRVMPLGVIWFLYYPLEVNHQCWCVACGQEENVIYGKRFYDCSKCLAESPLVLHRYCSRICMQKDWTNHKEFHELFFKQH